jgi:HK97 gp10 family phage protein
MAAEFKLEGFDELAAKLRALVPAMRKRVLRNALSAGARLVRDDAKRNAPVLPLSSKAPYRKPGTLKDAIRVRTSKAARRSGDIGVFVNVKPAKAGQRGNKSLSDPFYWRFQEFGWTPASKRTGLATKRERRTSLRAGVSRQIPGKKFLSNSAGKLSAALDIFNAQVTKWMNKVNTTGKIEP